jgi:phosphoribosylamine--glycine ligase
MKTAAGIKVIEFNARFGDPEALNTLALLSSDFGVICRAIIDGDLSADQVEFHPKASVARVIVPAGYGVDPKVGARVSIDETAVKKAGATVIFASCNLDPTAKPGFPTRITTTNSRTAAVVAIGATIAEAQQRTDAALKFIRGDIFFRTDIGTKASLDRKLASIGALTVHK